MQFQKGKAALVGAAISVTALLLSGCAEGGTGGGSGGADGEPIVVASVNALSGPGTFPEASQAAKAVFDEFNANGGLDGRPIEYVVLDDKGDPSSATAAARDAVEGNNAVALVGSASLLDCEVNSAYYEQNGIISIQGTGVDPVCFDSANISPANVGPFMDSLLSLAYGSEVLGLDNICGLVTIVGSQLPAYTAAFDQWTAATGSEFAMLDATIPYGVADWTPYIVKAKEAGCEAIYSPALEPDAVALLRAAEAQGMNDVTFLFATSAYSTQFAEAATFVGQGIYLPAEFTPFTDPSVPGNEEWVELMEKHNVPLTSFGQGGYLAANYFIEMLQSIEGDITRESVTAAFKEQEEPFESTMTGSPWIFGPGESHGSNTSGWPVVLEPGSSEWLSAADDWIRVSDFE